ncbi:DUF6599 family protein [Thermodesulfobacteriota bacterium]
MIQMTALTKASVFLFICVILLLLPTGARTEMTGCSFDLPKSVDGWTRPDSPQVINSDNIFKYMNGGGELYLGYRFDHLDVFEYTAENRPNILVEIYCMKSPDDAFGLLSLDWGGAPVELGNAVGKSPPSVAPPIRALYGSGLLRIWTNNVYVRILALRETAASKKAVLALGRAIVANRGNPPPPSLLKVLPIRIEGAWKLRNDRLGYFRSYLVLNTLFYISHSNILNLDRSTEALTAPYERMNYADTRERAQLLFVGYATPNNARKALRHFHEAFLPEQQLDFVPDSSADVSGFFQVEDGWLGYRLHGRCLALVFGCPDRVSAETIVNHIQFDSTQME